MATRKKSTAKGTKATKTTAKKATRATAAKKTTKKAAASKAKPKTAAKKAAKKVATKKVVTKKVAAKKVATKKVAAKKVATKKVAAKKATTKKVAAKKTATAVKRTASKSVAGLPGSAISSKQTKAQIYTDIAEMTEVGKAEVKMVFTALKNIVERHVKPKGSGEVTIPELGIKIRRVVKKATKSRMGRNPFTGEEIKIAAKPARKSVKATALKALKELA